MSDETTICGNCGNAIAKPNASGGSWLCVDCDIDKAVAKEVSVADNTVSFGDCIKCGEWCYQYEEYSIPQNEIVCCRCENTCPICDTRDGIVHSEFEETYCPTCRKIAKERARCAAIVRKYSIPGGCSHPAEDLEFLAKEIERG